MAQLNTTNQPNYMCCVCCELSYSLDLRLDVFENQPTLVR